MRVLTVLAAVACLGGAAARAELRLLAESGGRTMVVTGVENHQITGLDGARKMVLPAGAKFRLDGELKASSSLALWSPEKV